MKGLSKRSIKRHFSLPSPFKFPRVRSPHCAIRILNCSRQSCAKNGTLILLTEGRDLNVIP